MVVQATLMLFGSFFVMLFAGVPISAGIGIASIITAIMSGMDGNIFALTSSPEMLLRLRLLLPAGSAVLLLRRQCHE